MSSPPSRRLEEASPAGGLDDGVGILDGALGGCVLVFPASLPIGVTSAVFVRGGATSVAPADAPFDPSKGE